MAYTYKTFTLTEPVKIMIFLTKELNLPWSIVARMVDKGRVLVDGRRIIQKAIPVMGKVEVLMHEASGTGLKPIFQTNDFAVFNKPSGMIVHPNGFHVEESLVDEARATFGPTANVIHRLDRETSGLVIVGWKKKEEGEIKTLFQDRLVSKSYLAWVRGEVKTEQLIDAPILAGKNNGGTGGPKVIGKVCPSGKSSRTMVYPKWYVPEEDATLVEARPITGRTHQIRLHLFHIGHPLLGDPLYGVPIEVAEAYLEKRMSKEERIRLTGASRLMLHAYKLDFDYKSHFILAAPGDFCEKSFLLACRRES